MTTQGQLCDLLNSLLKADPENTQRLIESRVKFDKEKIKNVDVLVHNDSEIGVLGLVNSIVGYPVVAAAVNNETGMIDEFVLVGKEECSSP